MGAAGTGSGAGSGAGEMHGISIGQAGIADACADTGATSGCAADSAGCAGDAAATT